MDAFLKLNIWNVQFEYELWALIIFSDDLIHI